MRIAELCGYEVEVLEFMPVTFRHFKEMADRNIHNVPAGIIGEQALNFERHAGAIQAYTMAAKPA